MTTVTRSFRRASTRPSAPDSPAPAGPIEADRGRLSRGRRIVGWLVLAIAVVLVWEGAKWFGGDPWRIHGRPFGLAIDYEHVPPFHWRIADDLSIPHVWDVLRAFVDPAQRNGPPLGLVLLGQAVFTLGEAVFGFAWGSVLGLGLAILFVHSRLAERSLAPYVVASQTVPILAIAPIVIAAINADWLSVAFVTAYLSFFPVTIGALRGLRAADPRAHELLRSYAASPREILWKLRLPTSVPYVFTALRVAAAGSIIGAIIGEQTAGVASGLGSAIINYNQYYVAAPERLWATIVMTTLVGLAFVGLIVVAERLTARVRLGAARP
jgi:NitT/TauT family transport system permease protein